MFQDIDQCIWSTNSDMMTIKNTLSGSMKTARQLSSLYYLVY